MNIEITFAGPDAGEKYETDLVELLRDSVDGGASVGFLPPLPGAAATAYWHGVFDAMREGSRWMWIATSQDGALAGSVQLDLCMKANGMHRAEVSKLLVHSRARRQGIGRKLMSALEDDATAHGRTTLVLDTRAGDPSESVYQSIGWHKVGEIPEYARSANGQLHATAFYYKLLVPRPPARPTN